MEPDYVHDQEEPDLEDLFGPWLPNAMCMDCGLKYDDGCDGGIGCQGHQFCLPECPQCGGDGIRIDNTDGREVNNGATVEA